MDVDLAQALQAGLHELMDSGEPGRMFSTAGVAWRVP